MLQNLTPRSILRFGWADIWSTELNRNKLSKYSTFLDFIVEYQIANGFFPSLGHVWMVLHLIYEETRFIIHKIFRVFRVCRGIAES